MTAKEKAQQLVDKFRNHVNPYIGSSMLSNTIDERAILFQSKKCANIVCDEVIAHVENMNDYFFPQEGSDEDGMNGYDKIEFFKEVKNEIDKL